MQQLLVVHSLLLKIGDNQRIEKKITEAIEPYQDLTNILLCELKNQLEHIDQADAEEVGNVIDMLKDLAESTEKTVKAIYHEEILKAMEKSEYGADYNELGHIRKGYSEPLKSHMEDTKIYTTDKNYHDYKKHYEDAKSKGNTEEATRHLNKMLDEVKKDIQPLVRGMSDNEKSAVKNAMQNIITMV